MAIRAIGAPIPAFDRPKNYRLRFAAAGVGLGLVADMLLQVVTNVPALNGSFTQVHLFAP
jgi:hypothetical protein